MFSNLFIICLLLSLALAVCYSFIIAAYIYGWKKLPVWNIPFGFRPSTKVSIIVPARNEAENILACLISISDQTYPPGLYEVMVVDDHSTDDTLQKVFDFSLTHSQFRAIRLADFTQPDQTQSFKKKAIEVGVGLATGNLIVTTDADCEVQPDWLMLLVSFYEKNGWQFIAAPVNFHRECNLFERFQALDFLGMMCATAAGIRLRMMNMCNGANLAYPKSAFFEVNGFEGIDRLATGDDILLMQKIAARHPEKIGFLKNYHATVFTLAKPDVGSFLSQRIRWASKSTSYKEWNVTFILGMVFLFCCSLVLTLFSIPLWGWKAIGLFLTLFSFKMVADYFFLSMLARFFQRKNLMKSYLASQFLHIAYIVVVGILGNMVKKYEWKGRKVK